MNSETKRKGNKSTRPRIGVFKFASCDGCQLSLLDAEDELLSVVGAVAIAYFPEASRAMLKGPYDIGLVEGSITTHQDAERIQEVRRKCKTLITIGAFSFVLFAYITVTRLFPIIPVWEVYEGQLVHAVKKVGKALTHLKSAD